MARKQQARAHDHEDPRQDDGGWRGHERTSLGGQRSDHGKARDRPPDAVGDEVETHVRLCPLNNPSFGEVDSCGVNDPFRRTVERRADRERGTGYERYDRCAGRGSEEPPTAAFEHEGDGYGEDDEQSRIFDGHRHARDGPGRHGRPQGDCPAAQHEEREQQRRDDKNVG